MCRIAGDLHNRAFRVYLLKRACSHKGPTPSYDRLWGTFVPLPRSAATVAPLFQSGARIPEATMHGLIYLVGLIVVVLFILSFLGLR
jgi:hypothetical protein